MPVRDVGYHPPKDTHAHLPVFSFFRFSFGFSFGFLFFRVFANSKLSKSSIPGIRLQRQEQEQQEGLRTQHLERRLLLGDVLLLQGAYRVAQVASVMIRRYSPVCAHMRIWGQICLLTTVPFQPPPRWPSRAPHQDQARASASHRGTSPGTHCRADSPRYR